MQRLFSMFPNAWPGAGLLLLRLVSGSLLIHQALIGSRPMVFQAVAVVAGALLIAGLWTAAAGVLAMACEAWTALAIADDVRSAVLLASIGAALAAIGPGSTSLDNLLFGRKRFNAS